MPINIKRICAVLACALFFAIFNVSAQEAAPQDNQTPLLIKIEPPNDQKPDEGKQVASTETANEPEVPKEETKSPAIPDTTETEQMSAKKAKLGKLEVTGSHIKRIDLEGPTPLLVLDKEYIEQSGATTTYELLSKLPLNNGPLVNENKTQGTSPGGSTINLRGLGQGSTLILVDGRRVANYGYPLASAATFVDLNSIPLAAIDRVEVMQDGASAIYGADAIAGVVNVILKKNYVGTEISAGYGVSAQGDANETTLSLVTGIGTDTSNLTFTFNYFNRDGFLLGARDFSKSADQTIAQPVYGVDYTSVMNHPANYIDFFGAGVVINGTFDPNPWNSAVPDSERFGASMSYRKDLDVDSSLFADLFLNRVTTTSQSAPATLYPGDTAPSASDPFWDNWIYFPGARADNPTGNDLVLFWRLTDLGPRIDEVVTDSQRVVAGYKTIIHDWDVEAAVNYGHSESILTGKNYFSADALYAAFLAGQLAPFGTSSASDLDAIRITLKRSAESETIGADVKAVGVVGQTDAGPINLALGIETRRDELTDTPDAAIEAGDVPGQTGTRSSGHRSLQSAFSELNLPINDKTEMQLALRIDDYSDFDASTNPKIAVRYKPISNVVLRASAGTAFNAPPLPSMYQTSTTSITTGYVVDTTRCAATSGAAGCTPDVYNATLTGNPQLKAEESESYFLGGAIEPIKDFTVGLDYWNYNMKNIISFDAQYILNNESSFPGVVVRAVPGDPTSAIVSINDVYRNVAKIETDGVDLDLKYRWSTDVGSFMIRSFTSRTLGYDRQFLSSSADENLLGTFRYPKLRSVLSFAWRDGDYGAALAGNYIGKHQDNNNLFDHTIDSYTTWDAQFLYQGWKKTKLVIGIKNLLDEDPPFSNSDNLGYDSSMYDPTGRYYYANMSYQF